MLRRKDKDGKKAKLALDLSSTSESDSESELPDVPNINTFKHKAKIRGNDKSGKSNRDLTINKNYAQNYDNWRNLEEMQKLKDRLGVNNIDELKEENSTSESSSEEEDDWSAEKEKAFLKTLACLKTKDPKIYGDKFGFFKDIDNTDSPEIKIKKGDKKPFTVRDHERTMVLEKGGQFSDEEEGDNINGRGKSKSYPEELASIKNEFSKALKEIDSSDDEVEDSLLGSKLLKRRSNKSTEETVKEQEEYTLWLKGELKKVEQEKLSKEDRKELKSLRDYWNDDKLDEGEKFLRDYILNKKYIDPTKGVSDYIPSYNEVVHDDGDLSDDEKFEADREEFEHKYNFRFEEPDQDFIKRYPRTIQDSMRRDDTTRKEQRQKVKERKEDVKARKKEEVQRLKALKRKEIMSKLQKLQEITGDPNLDVSEVDIDGDFDPQEYDRRMQQIFNDDYYQENTEEEKPVFNYDKDIDDEENWDNWVPVPTNAASEGGEASEDVDSDNENDVSSEHVKEDAEFFGRDGKRAAVQQELIEASGGKRKRKRSAFLDVLEREKPKFDPKIHKSFEKYFEEYYNLEFEDIIGDVKCRFKYHTTTPNNFGLTTEEILKAEDKELNQWASLKKTFQYRDEREEEYEVKAFMKKAEKDDLKKQILPSMYKSTNDKTNDNDDRDDGKVKKRKKKNKKKNQGHKEDKGAINVERTEIKHEAEDTIKIDKVPIKQEKEEKPGKKQLLKLSNYNNGTDEDIVTSQNSKSQRRKLSQPSEESADSQDTSKLSKRRQKNKTQKSPKSSTEDAAISNIPKLSKRQRKNKKKGSRSESSDNVNISPPQNKSAVPNSSSTKKRYFENNNRGMKRKSGTANEAGSLDEDRLRSYGLNPKKFKKQMKYGGSVPTK